MSIVDGKMYTVTPIQQGGKVWKEVQSAINRRTKAGYTPIKILELFNVKWVKKPFPWSWSKEFRPKRRFFWHGTSKVAVQSILDMGFKPSTGGTLGPGVYATYHTNKSMAYTTDRYLISLMIYAPSTFCIHPGNSISPQQIASAPSTYDAIEVRSQGKVGGYTLSNHEICVSDQRRVVPRFIIKY